MLLRRSRRSLKPAPCDRRRRSHQSEKQYQWGPFEPGQLSPNETFTPTCRTTHPSSSTLGPDNGIQSTAPLSLRTVFGRLTTQGNDSHRRWPRVPGRPIQAEPRVEVIVDGRVRTHLLDTEMIGPTVTHRPKPIFSLGFGAGNPATYCRRQSNIERVVYTHSTDEFTAVYKPYACSNTACETHHAATRINDRSADGQGGVAQVIISGGIVGW